MKKVFVIVLVLAALLTAAYFYLGNRNRTLSPPGHAKAANGSLKVSIDYSRPSAKGRLIFGTEEKEALVPYGKYWRLGANEATQITFNKNVLFGGKEINAGTYRMYAIPGPDTFEIGLNSALDKWGFSEPNYSLDVVRTKVPVVTQPHVEQFTMRLENNEDGIDVICEWSTISFTIPVRPK